MDIDYDTLDEHGKVCTKLAEHGHWVYLTDEDTGKLKAIMMSIEDYNKLRELGFNG